MSVKSFVNLITFYSTILVSISADERKKGREQRKTDRASSPPPPSLNAVFSCIFSIRSLHYPGDWNRLSKV